MVQFDRISRTQNFERLDPEITFLIQRHSNKIPPNPQDRTGDNRQLYQIDGEVRSITDDEFYAFLKQQEAKLSNREINPESRILEYLPGLSKMGVDAAKIRGGEIAKMILRGEFNIVVFAGVTSFARTKSTNNGNLLGLEEVLRSENKNLAIIDLPSLFIKDSEKSFAELRESLEENRDRVRKALHQGFIPIINVPVEFFGEKELLGFGGGYDALKESGYLDYLNTPIG